MGEQKLRQLENSASVVGTVKENTIVRKLSKKGKDMLYGNLVIAVKEKGRINEIRWSFVRMATHKSFDKGLPLLDLKVGDRVDTIGNIDINEYASQNGFVSTNKFVLFLATKLEEDSKAKDRAIITLDTVIQGMEEMLDEDGLPNGNKKLNGFTVGYGSNVIELFDVVVPSKIADIVADTYPDNTTASITLRINNYVEEAEEAPVVESQHAFGENEKVETHVVKNYVHNLELIQGDLPYMTGFEYTEDEIKEALKMREVQKSDAENKSAQSKPERTQEAFSESASGSEDAGLEFNEDDLPF